MKSISILFVFFAKIVLGQVNYTDSLKAKLIDVSFMDDTTSSPPKHVLNFSLNIQPVSNLDSVSFSILDQNGNHYAYLGAYSLKSHPNGFYYLENGNHEKSTVTNFDAFFVKPVDANDYSNFWFIRLKYISNVNVVKEITYTIPR